MLTKSRAFFAVFTAFLLLVADCTNEPEAEELRAKRGGKDQCVKKFKPNRQGYVAPGTSVTLTCCGNLKCELTVARYRGCILGLENKVRKMIAKFQYQSPCCDIQKILAKNKNYCLDELRYVDDPWKRGMYGDR